MNIFDRLSMIGLGLQATKQLFALSEHATVDESVPESTDAADLLPVGALLVPVTDSLAKVAVLYGLSGLSALINANSSEAESNADWGAFQKSQLNAGQVWRILSYSLVHPSLAAALREGVAVSILGTATSRFQSFKSRILSNTAGYFVPLLVTAPQADDDAVLTNMSGSSYCLLGVFLASLATDRQRLTFRSQQDVLAATALGVLCSQMLSGLVQSKGSARKAGLASLGAGVISTVIMQIVRRVNAKQPN